MTTRPPLAAALIRVLFILTPLLAMSSPSPVAVSLSGLTLILIIALLWRVGEPPILLLPVVFQWSEVATLPLMTIWKQESLNNLAVLGGDLETSAAYGLAAISALAMGLRLGSAGNAVSSFADRLQAEARAWSLSNVLKVGLGSMSIGYLLSAMLSIAGPARELVSHSASIKYVGIFLIAYWCLINQRNYGLLAGVAAFEILIGMTGFFAAFKNSILTILVAVISARPRIRPSDLAASALIAAVLLFAATFWTVIKPEYRLLVNQGTGSQVVDIPLDERINFLLRALADINGAQLADGFDRLASRHAYIQYLALVMQNVPAVIPHEDGRLTMDVISHITMPRIFFPSKPPLPSDTHVMAKYTGLANTWNENTSISIGNLAELYIDFGLIGGVAAEFAIGLLIAFVYRRLRNYYGCSVILTAGLCVMIVLPIAYFGTAYIKLIGAFVFTSIIALGLQSYVAPRLTRRLDVPPFQDARVSRSMRYSRAPGSTWS
jgi:hypothetical protein